MKRIKSITIALLVTLITMTTVAMAADVHVWRVEGSGSVQALKNDQANGMLTVSDSSATFYYNIGDKFTFTATPANGWVFDKFCGDASCSTISQNSQFKGTIIQETGNLYVYFKRGTQISGDATVKVIVLSGSGKVDAYSNGNLIKSASDGDILNYKLGDSFKFEAKPSLGNNFTGFCTDTTCSQTVTTNPLSGTITQLTGALYVKFTPSLPGFELIYTIAGLMLITLIVKLRYKK
jgi:hypothetical protein